MLLIPFKLAALNGSLSLFLILSTIRGQLTLSPVRPVSTYSLPTIFLYHFDMKHFERALRKIDHFIYKHKRNYSQCQRQLAAFCFSFSLFSVCSIELVECLQWHNCVYFSSFAVCEMIIKYSASVRSPASIAHSVR